MIIELKDIPAAKRQQYLQYVIAPRPICFASTINKEGIVNLSPFSFFNLFSSDPPIVIFSPARRVRNNTIKHTLENVLEVPEVAINIVTYDMVQQASLASCEYPNGVDEFIKAGFTPRSSVIIKPPLVKESKVKMECKVIEVKPLGTQGGAGNLVICEILLMHIDDSILNEEGGVDQTKLELVARLGGDWYTKVDAHSLFQVTKPHIELGIGIDALPYFIRNSDIFSGNDLGALANVHEMPVIDPSYHDDQVRHIVQYFERSPELMERELQWHAKKLLQQGKVKEAWQVLLSIHF